MSSRRVIAGQKKGLPKEPVNHARLNQKYITQGKFRLSPLAGAACGAFAATLRRANNQTYETLWQNATLFTSI